MKNTSISVLPRWVINLFFWIGLTAAVCVRCLNLVARVDADLATAIWRLAMVCYILFFGYRFLIGRKRRRVVIENRLIERFEGGTDLAPEVRDSTLYILRSITRSKELLNFVIILILSVCTLSLDLWVAYH